LGLVASVFQDSISGDLVYATTKVKEEKIMDTLRRGAMAPGRKIVILSYIATFLSETDWAYIKSMECPVFILDSRGKNLQRNLQLNIGEHLASMGEIREIMPGCLGVRAIGASIMLSPVKYSTWCEGGSSLSIAYTENLLKVQNPEIVEICPALLYLTSMRPHLKLRCRDKGIQAMLRIFGIPYEDAPGMPLVNTMAKVGTYQTSYFIPAGKLLNGVTDVRITPSSVYVYIPVQSVAFIPAEYPTPTGSSFLREGSFFCCTAAKQGDCEVTRDTYDRIHTLTYLFVPFYASVNSLHRRGDAFALNYAEGVSMTTVLVRDVPQLVNALAKVDISTMPPGVFEEVYGAMTLYDRVAFTKFMRLCYRARKWVDPKDFYASVRGVINWGAYYDEAGYQGDPFLSFGIFVPYKRSRLNEPIISVSGHPTDVVSDYSTNRVSELPASTLTSLSDNDYFPVPSQVSLSGQNQKF